MKAEVLQNLDNPRQLEKLYRNNSTAFKKEFNAIYPSVKENTVAQIWYERLNFEHEGIYWGTEKEIAFVLLAATAAGLIAKIPSVFLIDPEFFYPRNIAFIVFPLLTIYFLWKQKLPTKTIIIAAFITLASAVYINLLPRNDKSDTFILACIHLPLLLWAVLGFTYLGDTPSSTSKRLDFLRYNGDLVVMTTIILIAGGLMSAVTLGLFQLIGLHIETFYTEYIVVWGLAAAPIVCTYLIQTNPQLVNKVSPVIAKIFTPLVLIMLLVYLAAVLYTGKDPYNNREFLLIFNALLLGVMALIVFSVAEASKSSSNKWTNLLLLALSIVTILVNGIALSAILFRISEWGITPNRLAVLGGNVLILTNLLLVTYRLFKATNDSRETDKIEESVVSFLPIYGMWALVVTFVFPLAFHFH
ncbi:DUF4153 domain-containing protein [Hymenobacter wooponensis]|uniref:DUF4153 domain-containing protein n=1 Tax=Hymenobacter wooponensis TaxID=1525360 RepID=A0A4Z0MUV0_9BACT|nr:DUF4153 domain-containing protein [Hymenobacter wooponensis]TGD83250.1 DUF4153 domain-containing protein [Hymenobacter wooponensis]